MFTELHAFSKGTKGGKYASLSFCAFPDIKYCLNINAIIGSFYFKCLFQALTKPKVYIRFVLICIMLILETAIGTLSTNHISFCNINHDLAFLIFSV